MSGAASELSEHELAVLGLSTEDAYCLWEVAAEVGGDRALAARVVKSLVSHGLAELGVEAWVNDKPVFYDENGNYAWCPCTGDVDGVLADDESWRSEAERKIVVAATEAGQAVYFGSGG